MALRKRVKNLIFLISLGVTFVLFGLFFVGCGQTSSNLALKSDVDFVELFVGESKEVRFTIENFGGGNDGRVSFSLIDSTVSPTVSEHVALEVVSQKDELSVVKLTGLSGGKTQLVATTFEGSKIATVDITVRQYSDNVSLNDTKKMYVSKTSDFVPNETMFIFDNDATEKGLTYHLTDLEEEVSEENHFVRAKLQFSEEKGLSVVFSRSDQSTFERAVNEGDQLNFIARYENAMTSEVIFVRSTFYVLSGFSEENVIKTTLTDNQITLVSNGSEARQTANFEVTLPRSEQGFVRFDFEAENRDILSVERNFERNNEAEGTQTYSFSIVSTTVVATKTSLRLKVYYVVGDQSFESGDSSVSQSLTIPVEIKVAPTRMFVNNADQNAPENTYNFYNYYDGDYGWREFDVKVFATDASFECVSVEFDNDIIVKHKGMVVASPYRMTDLSSPLLIRGKANAVVTAAPKEINFKVQSSVLETEINFTSFYSITTGAQELKFDDPIFDLKQSDKNSGIFVSASATDLVFKHLLSDYAFGYATVSYHDGDQTALRATYQDVKTEGNDKVVGLKLIPQKVGEVSYKVMLDNGVFKVVTFKVVATFDNLSINLAGTGNDGVQSSEKLPPAEDVEDSMKVVIQNASTDSGAIYEKNATVELNSSQGTAVFDDIQYFLSANGIISIREKESAAFSVSTNSYGVVSVDFVVTGKAVDDFRRIDKTLTAQLHVTSFVPVSTLELSQSADLSASNVSVYLGSLVTDPALQTATFAVSSRPSMAYGFYDPRDEGMKDEMFKKEFLYWSLNGAEAFVNDGSTEPVTRMLYGATYKIGPSPNEYFGLFDTTNMTFSVNKNYPQKFVFTMFASLRQYGVAKYYPITVNGLLYDNVERIYTNLSQENSLTFTTSKQNFEIGVYLGPNTATNLNVEFRYTSTNNNALDPVLIAINDVSQTEIKPGVHIFNLQLNPAVLSATLNGSLSGELEIIPSAWYVDGRVISGYENSTVKIKFSYANGTEENRYVLETADDVIAIGQSAAAMASHYKISTKIDMTGYESYLPLGYGLSDSTFSGSIVGDNNAEISGIKLNSKSLNNGFFSVVSGQIENVKFSGHIELTLSGTANVGLVAGVLEGGTLKNIKVQLATSTINLNTISNVGGMVGKIESTSTVSNMNVIFDGMMSITASVNVNAGGIAGYSNSDVTGIEDRSELYGYSAYSVFAMIEIKDEKGQLAGTAGGAIGNLKDASLSNMLLGGEVWAGKAAGIVAVITYEKSTEVTISNSTTRTNVRGNDIGLVVYERTSSNTLTITDIAVEATDDGLKTGIEASMGIMFFTPKQISGTNPPEFTTIPELDAKRVSGGIIGLTMDGVTLSSYINRTAIEEPYPNIGQPFTTDEYFGDFIVVEDNQVASVYSFDKKTTSFAVAPNTEKGFKYLTTSGFQPGEKISGEGETAKFEPQPQVKIIYAYYFEAAGYYENGEFISSDLQKAQDMLSELNYQTPTDQFYPLSISSSEIKITSKSPLVEINSSNDLLIKGTGIAELEISSIVNQGEVEKVYLYIINYFSIKDYFKTEEGVSVESGIFTLGGMTLGNETEFPVYSSSGVDVMVSPAYTASIPQTGEEPKTISRDGYVKIGNSQIKLKKSMSVSVEVDGTMNYGSHVKSRDGVTFVKKANIDVSAGVFDQISMKAKLSCSLNGTDYILPITTLDNVKITYYEGSTKVSSAFDNYVISTGTSMSDKVMITTDDLNDNLLYEITDQTGKIVGSSEKSEMAEPINKGLFVASIKKDTSSSQNGQLAFDVSVSVNRASSEFADRFNTDIYKTYKLTYYAKSNGKNVFKSVEITLVRESVDVIAFSNYPYFNDLEKGESPNVVPGVSGMLSVTVSPMDADFDYIEILNDQINYAAGGSVASFSPGYFDNNNPEQFKVIRSEPLATGIRVQRSDLETIPNYQGQFFLKYIFSNNSVTDGGTVAVVANVVQHGGNFSSKIELKVHKESSVFVAIKNHPAKTMVAKGLEYELDVQAIGYSTDSIKLTSSDVQLARIEVREGKYYLIVGDNIDVSSQQAVKVVVNLTASKLNEFGELIPASYSLELQILEYVINYTFDNAKNEDIISGMHNGVIQAAIGDKIDLSVAFEGMIEYDQSNANVVSLVNLFLSSLQNTGEWKLYTDLNVNNASGIPIKPLPLKKENATVSTFGKTDVVTPYLQTNAYSFVTLKSNSPEQQHYFFTFDARFKIEKGRYVVIADGTEVYNRIYTQFGVYSYMRGSEVSPNPITSYDEFLNMEAGGYYILLNDIDVPASTFQPINTEVAYFDGNGHSFLFKQGTYDLTTLSSAGLFANVGINSLIKNVSIVIGGSDVTSVEFNSKATSSVVFGFVAGTNSGAITNAKVTTHPDTTAHVTFANTPATKGYFYGSVVGQNSGYITNSRAELSIESMISMGGIVGQNLKIVSSSAFVGGNLVCTSQYNSVFVVGGVAAENTENAAISTSYASGIVGDKPYSTTEAAVGGKTSKLLSSVEVAGFVHTNEGKVVDCYSSIPVSTSSKSCGFVFTNSGRVERCFSTSMIVEDFNEANYYFAGESSGMFIDCYYIKDEDINQTLSKLSHTGVKPLTVAEFANLSNFEAYGYSGIAAYNSVWFFSDGSTGSLFGGQKFAKGRLELVSANIQAFSQKENIGTTVDANGVVTYRYATAPGSPEDGSALNPFVIYSPESMESYLSSPNRVADKNYRLVKDIDYSSVPSDFSKLYQIELRGNFEGNAMTIQNVNITSKDVISSAGLFSKIVGGSARASAMNLNIIPKKVAFSNASTVGTLAGTVQNANIFNVNVFGSTSGADTIESESLVTVSGSNVVGGVIGHTLDGFTIKNITSIVSAFATRATSAQDKNDFESDPFNELSFAGGTIGYVGGSGNIDRINMPRGAINSIGSKAGLMFGGIGPQAKVTNTYITINSSMILKPFTYGGLVVGELKGSMKNTYVYGTGTQFPVFSLKPFVAKAVGGIVGIMQQSASLDTAYMSQDFIIENEPSATVNVNTIESVGGIVGIINGAFTNISKVVVDADINARNTLGGIVGKMSEGSSLTLTEGAVKAGKLKVEGQVAAPAVGGLVGEVAVTAALTISDSYNQTDIDIETYVYTTDINASYGGIIGRTQTTQAAQPTIDLRNIYSTSRYDIKVEDKSSTDIIQPVLSATCQTDKGPQILQKGDENGARVYSINGQTEKLTDNKEFYPNGIVPVKEIGYTLNSIQKANVYNSSILGLNTDWLDKGFTTISARKFNSLINIFQNEYGTDLYSYNSARTTGIVSPPTDQDLLNMDGYFNLFNGETKWAASESAYSTLVFEKGLILKKIY